MNQNIRRAMAEALGWKVFAYTASEITFYALRAPNGDVYSAGKPVRRKTVKIETESGVINTWTVQMKRRDTEAEAWEDLPSGV